MESGRFLNDQDNCSHGLYGVIRSGAKDKLFSGIPPVGETIRINGVSFQVVGVIKPRMQEGDNDENRSVYVPFSSFDVLHDNHYIDGFWLVSQGWDHQKHTKTICDSLD